MKLVLFLILLVSVLSLREKIERLSQPLPNQVQNIVFEQKQYWFDQIFDHFDYKTSTTNKLWSQRYWVIDQYFNPKVGPVFLFICGEYTCNGVPEARKWVLTLAERLQGIIITLEHRFYGRSLPFGYDSYTLQNMRLLNSQQALKDLAWFTQQIVSNKMYKITNNPWISVGGSYPGALSAWYRYKYPHLTIGAIASSAVITAEADFKNFDQQMFLSANKSGDFCVKAINDSSSRVEAILKTEAGAAFKAGFEGASKLNDKQFLFYWADSIVGEIQYGNRSKLCAALKGKSSDDQFALFTSLVKTNDVHEYGSYYLKNATYYAEKQDSSRAWMFQCCTEYGWWQTFSDVHPMRSKQIDINFYRQFCLDSFGTALWPDVDRKNTQYGGYDLKAFNLLMANGDQDPWKWVSLRQSKGNIISRVANCTDCGHCVDLYTPLTSDSNELKKIRDEQFLTISEWIETYWQSVKTVNPNSWSEKLEKITFQSVKSIPILKNILTHEQ